MSKPEDTVPMTADEAKYYYQHKTARWETFVDAIKWIVVTFSVLTVLIGIGLLIAHNIDSDRQIRLSCVDTGKQWVAGNCVGGK